MANEGDAERLVVMLEARIRDFEKNMAKASGTATTSYTKMRKGSRTATQQMETDMARSTDRINKALAVTSTKIGSFGKSLLIGLTGGLFAGGIAAFTSQIGRMTSEIAEVGDAARRAGLDARSFQELAYVAKQNRIGVDALTDGMKELQLRADEFIVTGAGSAAESFRRLGYDAETLNDKLQDPSALFTEIIGKLGQLDRAAQIRVADELFGGTGGEQFVQLIAQGEEGIKRTIDEAHALGLVMDAEMIAKAAEVDRKFGQIADTVGTAIKGAIVEAAAALAQFLDTLKQSPAFHFQEITDRAAAVHDEIDGWLAAAQDAAPGMVPEIKRIVEAFDAGTMSADDASAALREMGAVDLSVFPISTGLSLVISRLELLKGRAEEAAAAVEAASMDPVGAGASWEGMQDFLHPKSRTKPGSGTSTRSKAEEEAERQQKAIDNLIASLEFEKTIIGLNADEQERLTLLRSVNVDEMSEQGKAISQLVRERQAEQHAVENLTQLYDMLGNAGTSAIEGIIDAMADGKIEAEELSDILAQVLRQASSSLLQGGLNFLGTAIGGALKLPGFASGTSNTGGSRGDVRGVVHGQEAVIPLPSGGSVPVQVTGGASAMPMEFNFDTTINIDGKGSGLSREELAAILAENNRRQAQNLKSQLPGLIRQAQLFRKI